jgi:nitrite reductase/ring-hydroxylating ferredoxin subunit
LAEKSDRWTAIGIERQVLPGSSNPVLLGGFPLAMWRPESGVVNVWEDRCPHRGMRLSYGFVRGDMLRCIYHGWGYGSGGQCVSIPAHPDLTPPGTICANSFPSRTRYGLVWTNLAKDGQAPLPEAWEAEGWTPIRSVYVRRTEREVRESVERIEAAKGGEVEATEEAIIVRHTGEPPLLMAVHPLDADRTALHAVARLDGAFGTAARLGLAEKMVRLRGALEAR